MTHMLVLLLTVFFYGTGNPPSVETAAFSTPEACAAVGAKSKAHAEADDKVSYATFTCVDVERKEKV